MAEQLHRSIFQAVRDPGIFTDDSSNTPGAQVYTHGWLLAERLARHFQDTHEYDLTWQIAQDEVTVVPVTGKSVVRTSPSLRVQVVAPIERDTAWRMLALAGIGASFSTGCRTATKCRDATRSAHPWKADMCDLHRRGESPAGVGASWDD